MEIGNNMTSFHKLFCFDIKAIVLLNGTLLSHLNEVQKDRLRHAVFWQGHLSSLCQLYVRMNH